MAGGVFCGAIFFVCLLTISCAGNLVGFSCDARRNSESTSIIKTISLLKERNFSATQIRLILEDSRLFPSLSNAGIGIPVDVYVDGSRIESSTKSKDWASLWLKNHIIPFLPYMKISRIVVGSKHSAANQLPLILKTLYSIHLAVKRIDLDGQVKLTVELPLVLLQKSDQKCLKCVQRIAAFIRKHKSIVTIESSIEGMLSLEDQFSNSMLEKTLSAAKAFRYRDIPIILKVKSSAFPSILELTNFTGKVIQSLGYQTQVVDRIHGLFVEICPMEGNGEKEQIRKQEESSFSFPRELLETTKHDLLNSPTIYPTTPIINPGTPIVVPPPISAPAVVTVPGTVLPTNPIASPITNPFTSPITTPVTGPVITVPSTNLNPPSPYCAIPPPGVAQATPFAPSGVVSFPPPATSSPLVSGQSWCVAKPGAADKALQTALDYACGMGGADCSAIQQTGSCYNPNTLHDHASYAFNSYYQKSPTSLSCDFGGNAMIVNTNPSSASCIYPSSSNQGSSATPSSSSSSSVLNTYSPSSSAAVLGTPSSSETSGAADLLGRHLLLWILSAVALSFCHR